MMYQTTLPATKWFAITPNDSADLAEPIRGIMVGADGALRALFVGDTTPVTIPKLVAGIVYPFEIKRVYNTGTDATGITGGR